MRSLLRSRSRWRTPKPPSPTCASRTPAAIDAIRMPARAAGIWQSPRQGLRLGHGHPIGASRPSDGRQTLRRLAQDLSAPLQAALLLGIETGAQRLLDAAAADDPGHRE